jgi:hypothetical protein
MSLIKTKLLEKEKAKQALLQQLLEGKLTKRQYGRAANAVDLSEHTLQQLNQ